MTVKRKLFPAAFLPKIDLTATVYYVAFPDRWRDCLFEIEELRRGKPFTYNLPTSNLDKLLLSWLPEVVSCSAIGKSKDNTKWLITCEPLQSERLLEVVKIWVANEYVMNSKFTNMAARDKAKEFYQSINNVDLCSVDATIIELFQKDGTAVGNETFRVLPLLIMRKLMGQRIELSGRTFKFLSASKNSLLTEPIEVIYRKKKTYFSIFLEFSVQTIPPMRQALLLYHLKVRRWVTRPSTSWDFKVDRDTTKAYLRVSEDKLQEMKVVFDWKSKNLIWDEMDKSCYEFCWIHNELPDIKDVIESPEEFIHKENNILVTYRYAIDKGGIFKHIVKPGLPMQDRLSIHNWLSEKLKDLLIKTESAEAIKRQLPGLDDRPIEDLDKTVFRQRMAQAIGGNKLVIEVYCHDDSEIGLKAISTIKEPFGMQEERELFSELEVTVRLKSLGEIDAPLDARLGPLQRYERRIEEISEKYGKAAISPTACLIVLPGKNDFNDEDDPKKAIRAGFALTGRLTQFIMPEADYGKDQDDEQTGDVHRINSAIYDLYRQLGYLMPLKPSGRINKVDYSIPAVALWVINYKKTIYGSINKIPVFVRTDFITGQVRVDCEYFSRPNLLYWEACLEFQRLPSRKDIKSLQQTGFHAPIKKKFLELYNIQKDPILVLVKADGISRTIFKMISDSELAKADRAGTYTINKLWFDNADETGIMLNKRENGIRIIRVRGNDEVPDYLTDINLNGNAASRSGLYKYQDNYWSIAQRPGDKLYRNTETVKSKILQPSKECKSPDMIELFPIYLKNGDDPDAWVYLAHQLRKAAHQYKETLRMPLPLHLAHKLEEYLG